MTQAEKSTVIALVLDGMAFPAQRWQVLAQAELYGADFVTKEDLRRLPARSYAGHADVSRTLAAL